MAIDEEIVNVIHAATIGFTKGTNLFMGPIRAPGNSIPGKACFVLETEGRPPINYCDGSSKETLKMIGVQIVYRGQRGSSNDYGNGQAIANTIHSTIHQSTTASSLTQGVLCDNSKPNYIGKDETDHHLWSINAIVYKGE